MLIMKFQVFTLLSIKRWWIGKLLQFKSVLLNKSIKKQRIELESEDDEEPDRTEDEQEFIQVTPHEALAVIDRLVHTSGISNDDQSALFGIKENLERIVITQEKKKDIRDYF